MTKLLKGAKIALKTAFRHKMRSALATAGIIIGVCSVIVMVAVGEGAQKEVLAKIQAMGTDLVVVTAGQVKVVAGRPKQTGKVTTLTMGDLKSIEADAQYLKQAAPFQGKRMLVKYEAASSMTNVNGTTEAILTIRNLRLKGGRFFTDEEDKTSQRVAVIGRTVATNLFGTRDPVGETVRVGRVPFEIVGTLAEKGTDLVGADQDDVILIPINTALRRLMNVTYINNIFVQAKGKGLEQAAVELREILRVKHRLKGKPDDFTVQEQSEIVKTERETSRNFTRLLGSVAAISLLVGGVGILAVMLISVKERTREIGLRRAVGALKRDLWFQFMAESLFLSLTGGFVGIVFGVAGAVFLSHFTKWPTAISVPVMLGAFVFSATIGMVFGTYPAARAARLDPIVALRAE